MSFMLPVELHVYTLSYLDTSDLIKCSEVSKGWKVIAEDALLNFHDSSHMTNKILNKISNEGKITAFFGPGEPALRKIQALFTSSTKKDFIISDLSTFPMDFSSWDKVLNLISEKVEVIDFGCYSTITSKHLQTIKRFPNLKKLSINACNLENKDITAINRVSLESLSLSSAFNINYKMFLFLPRTLSHLSLTHTTIDDESVKRLPTNIRHLQLGWIDGLTKDGLFQLTSKLDSIQMNDCFKIPYEDSDEWNAKRPEVHVRHTNFEPY